VLGLLQNMEKAGLVAHEQQGVTYLYRSAVSRREATGSLLSDFLARFFHGSAEQLILGLVDADQLAPEDLRAIEARIDAAEARAPSPPEVNPSPKGLSKKRRKTP
jgi:predicted transcriptional regulator